MQSPEQGGQRPTTFAELEKKENVSATELIETLKNYVGGGAAIADRVVLSLIHRTELTDAERETIKQLAQKGVDLQTARQETKAAKEYQAVVDQM